jgi:asparagine synthase (glutamine-hydrolysing)
MCGICGIVDFDRDDDLAQRIGPMVRSLNHRGPDQHGTWTSRHVALGHTRLSIIDLTEDGRQPMCNEDATVWVTYNGEVYNFQELRQDLVRRGHAFRSRTDTEVLVHLYEQEGIDSVTRLRGMFAYTIWDTSRRCAYMVRDRLGIKPLYYGLSGGRLAFGSEIKAILAHGDWPRRLRPEAMSDYLTFLYVPAPKTIFQDVHKLPGGHWARFDAAGLHVQQYWDLPDEEQLTGDAAAIQDELIERLRQSVKMRLVSDVALGAFLSGGVDSSAVVALMSAAARSVTTVSVGFPQRSCNELPHAARVARRYRTEHHEEMVAPDAAALVGKLAWHYDEPFGDCSAVPTFCVSRAARRHVTVALSGDGGDENFGGYRRYAFDLWERRARRWLPRLLRRTVVGAAGRLYPKGDWMPRSLRLKRTLEDVALDAPEAYTRSVGFLSDAQKALIWRYDMARQLEGYRSADIIRQCMSRRRDDLRQLLYTDIKTYLVDDILTKVDRASMAVALEVRVPLLDHTFVEWAHRVPGALKVRGTSGKCVLKAALRDHLDEDTLYRPKQGFTPPLSQWLTGSLSEMVGDMVLGPQSACAQFVQPRAIAAAWRQLQTGWRDTSRMMWSLLMFELWWRTFMTARSTDALEPAPQPQGAL